MICVEGHPETGDSLFIADPEKPALEDDLTLTLIRILPLPWHPKGTEQTPISGDRRQSGQAHYRHDRGAGSFP
jgi:hypothetical protein